MKLDKVSFEQIVEDESWQGYLVSDEIAPCLAWAEEMLEVAHSRSWDRDKMTRALLAGLRAFNQARK